jgi:hypothetical protein
MPSPSSAHLPLTDELAAVFARMTGLLLSEDTVAAALGLLSSLAQEAIPGASGAGVSIIDEQHRRSSGSTDERVLQADNRSTNSARAPASPQPPNADSSGSTICRLTGGGRAGRTRRQASGSRPR